MTARAQDGEASREAQVLELLRKIPTQHARLYSTTVFTTTNEYGYTQVAPRVVGCGVGWRPAFDPELARSLARELFVIYGLQPEANVQAPHIQSAVLDCFDAKAGIGLKLRGRLETKPESTWQTVLAEPANTDLDVEEHKQLFESKVRIHVADVASYWAASAEDRMTTTLTYLAGVAAFLNEATDGEDVDCQALLPLEGRWLVVPTPKKQRHIKITTWSGGCNLVVSRKATVALAIDPATAFVNPDTPKAVAPNADRPVTVQLFGLSAMSGSYEIELFQSRGKGKTKALCTSDNDLLLVPGIFDSERPFSIQLQLQPGEYRVSNRGWISGAGPDKR